MVVEAAFVGFLRTLLIIGVVWFIIRLVRQLMQQKRASENLYSEMKRQQANHHQQQNRTVHDDGKTRVEYIPKDRNGNPLQSDGEYVDYEEVE